MRLLIDDFLLGFTLALIPAVWVVCALQLAGVL